MKMRIERNGERKEEKIEKERETKSATQDAEREAAVHGGYKTRCRRDDGIDTGAHVLS
jgi:hypothetical protein